MSTKTTFKRVALVAVASLGFGLVSSVAPASAAVSTTPTAISIGATGGFVPGSATLIPVTITLPAGVTLNSDTFTVVARVTSAPDASNSIGNAASGSVAARATTAAGTNLAWANPTRPTSGSYSTIDAGTKNSLCASNAVTSTGECNWTHATSVEPEVGDLAGQVTLWLSFTPDAAGAYTLLVAATGSTNSVATVAGQATSTLAGLLSTSLTATTSASPTTVTLTPVNATAATTVASGGSMVKVTLATGAVPSLLATGQSVTLSASSSTVTFSDSVLTAGDFSYGTAYVNVYNTAEEVVTITAAQSGTLSTLTAGTKALTFVAGATSATAVIGVTPSQTSYVTASASAPDDLRWTASTARATQTVCITDSTVATATAAAYSYLTFTDVSGKLTGKTNATFGVPVTIAASATAASRYGCATVNGTLLNTEYFIVNALSSNATDQMRITGATRAASTITVTPTATLASAAAATNTFTFTVKDAFGGAMAGESVTLALAGRNAATTATAISNASGQVTHSVTDAGTVGTTDTLTASVSGTSATKSVTITYGTTTAGTLTLTGGNTTAGVTSSVKTVNDIAAGTAGAAAAANRVTITATMKDASGALLAGVPVTWSVAGSGVAIPSTALTSYTAADGTATSSVYGWLAGSYVVTATGGGKTATAEVTFGQTSASEARTVSASVSGQIVTAKIVDRFGNPISGVTVYASKVSGSGYFGGGVSKTYSTTGQAGTVEFAVVGGAASIKVATLSYDAVAGSKPADQTCARATAVDCNDDAADDTAFTATTVGTTTTAETGVGASFSAAGVSSATVDVTADTAAVDTAQAATDAAAEATDAANAATDAANAAAEAADAATAAAQDAADAVAALSTQVSEMVNALKKQITALTNLVIKIQKKVRA